MNKTIHTYMHGVTANKPSTSGRLLVTKKQIANQAVCPWCRRISSKSTHENHISDCKTRHYGDGRKLYDSFGAPLQRPKPVQTVTPVKSSKPRLVGQQTHDTRRRDQVLSRLVKRLRLGEEEPECSVLEEFQQASSQGTDNASSQEVVYRVTDYFDYNLVKDNPWVDVGINVQDFADSVSATAGSKTAGRLLRSSLYVLPPPSTARTETEGTLGCASGAIIGGCPMTNPDTVAQKKSSLCDAFSHEVLPSVNPDYVHLHTTHWDKLLSKGWEQRVGDTTVTGWVAPHRFSVVEASSGDPWECFLSYKVTYDIAVTFPCGSKTNTSVKAHVGVDSEATFAPEESWLVVKPLRLQRSAIP